ncbi:MAG: AAA family ATPase [Planctomycetaceae bacterium]
MGQPIDRITIKGFKSIESLENLKLTELNVLIGANGAGKSNFVDFFRMLRAFADERFQKFVNESGGGDGFLFLGPKVTPSIWSRLEFGQYAYVVQLSPTAAGSLHISSEDVEYCHIGHSISQGSLESKLSDYKHDRSIANSRRPPVARDVYELISNRAVYHFHDTTPLSAMRRDQSLRDNEQFHHDASNIAPLLLNLQTAAAQSYELIRDTVRLIAPFFDDFLLRPQTKGPNELVRLEWNQKGSDFPFQPYQLSDGTIRFICLATALLQPNPPATIVIDEPELGLHPYAISILADLIKSASKRTQVIISTQSPTLLDYFDANQIIVVNRRDGRSIFERLDPQDYAEWIDDYSVGELWQKNVVRGGPTRE